MRRTAFVICFSALCLAALAATPVAAQTSRVGTAPPPILRNSNPPRQPVRNPAQRHGSPPRKHEQYTALEFRIWTGDDDLRETSLVWVDLNFSGGSQTCYLHRATDDFWVNHSEHVGRQCILSTPKSWSQLRAASMVLNMSSKLKYGLESPDNWNVNRVVVTAIDPTDKHYPCLLDVRGRPLLVRMKEGTGDHYDLTETENHC